MKKLIKPIGFGLMVAGVGTLAVLHVVQLTFVTLLLFVPLAMVLVGFVLIVWGMKRESRY